MDLKSNLDLLRSNYQRYGLSACVHDLTKKSINRVLPFRMMSALKLTWDGIDKSFLETSAELEIGFVEDSRLWALADEDGHDLDREFLATALGKGDRCVGIWIGGRLASYGWYSRKPTRVDESLIFSFSPDWVYMYKGFTHHDFRGRRLHAIGMAYALDAHRRESRGIVSYVESHNFASLKSCYRMGYQDIGRLCSAGLAGRHITWGTGDCGAYDLRLLWQPQ